MRLLPIFVGITICSHLCDDGWALTSPYPSEEGTWMRVTCSSRSWHDAQKACEADNGWLAVVKYISRHVRIYNLGYQQNPYQDIWIGATDHEENVMRAKKT